MLLGTDSQAWNSRYQRRESGERIIRIVGSELGLSASAAELEWLRKHDPCKEVRGMGEGPHRGEERLAGQPSLHGPSCGHEPVGEPDLKKYEKII